MVMDGMEVTTCVVVVICSSSDVERRVILIIVMERIQFVIIMGMSGYCTGDGE